MSLKISSITDSPNHVKFGKTPFENVVQVAGKLGSFDVKLVSGLQCRVVDGVSPEESRLLVEINQEKLRKFSKYQLKFVKSMHGTTNSLLKNYVDGVAEVTKIFLIALIIIFIFTRLYST